MTTHNQRSIPHPVLGPMTQDYQEGAAFTAEVLNIKDTPEGHRIIVAVQYHLDEPALAALIQEGAAQFTTLTSSSAGRLRENHPTREKRQEITLDSRRYAGTLAVQSMITASQDIPGFRSNSWNPELKDFLPNGTGIPEGGILAIDHVWASSPGDTEPLESCVAIITNDGMEPGEFDVGLEDNLITLKVNQEYREKLDHARSGEKETYLWPSVYLTAIWTALHNCLEQEHQDKHWAQVIRRRLEAENIETEDTALFQARSLVYAQRLMEQPLKRITEEARDE